jgi:hypothetical protein
MGSSLITPDDFTRARVGHADRPLGREAGVLRALRKNWRQHKLFVIGDEVDVTSLNSSVMITVVSFASS